MNFNFYFFEVPSAFGHPTRVRRGISAADGPEGRYNTYFHALAMEIDKENISSALAAVNSIIKGECKEYSLGGGAWVIHIRPTVVEFESSNCDELNTGENNILPVKEFKWVLAAWSEFLDIPDQAGGTQYEFTLPVSGMLDVESVAGLLKPA